MPVRSRVVHGASPQRVVREADPALLQPFIDAARALVNEGAAAITTSCGFLVRWQAALQAAVPVPVWTSSLLLLPDLRWPGVLTVDAQALASVPAVAGVPLAGLAPGCHLQRAVRMCMSEQLSTMMTASLHVRLSRSQHLAHRDRCIIRSKVFLKECRTSLGEPHRGLASVRSRHWF